MSNNHLLSKLNLLQEQLYLLTNKSKQNYYARIESKLTNVQQNSKTYWSLLNRFLNKNIRLIPPLFHENEFVTVSFSQEYIVQIIQNVDPNKVHGHDRVSILMLKIYGSSIYKPLEIIFWIKKSKIVLIPKKKRQNTLTNYSPVSLLPVWGRVLEKLLFNEVFKLFIENKLIPSNQSNFKPGDSCINQLLSVWLKSRSVFLDISKAFDQVWHDHLQTNFKWNIGELTKSFAGF